MRRIFVLLKIIFKLLIVLLSLFLIMIWLMDINHIDKYVPESVSFGAAFMNLIKVGRESIPLKDLLKYYKDNMLIFGIHKGITNSVCILCSLPLIPLFLKVLFSGWGSVLDYVAENLTTRYVYVDTGKYAFTRFNDEVLFFPLFNFAVKLFLIWGLFELSPFIFLITLAINILQLIWISPGEKEASAHA